MGLSFSEIMVIAIVILLLFGAKKIPELARSLGRASYEFKKAKEELLKESGELVDVAEKKAAHDDAAESKKDA